MTRLNPDTPALRLLAFLSERCRPLAKVPLLPHLFDAALLAVYAVCFPRRFTAMETLFEEALSWPGVSTAPHRFGGRELRVGKRELGHLHGNGVLDVLLSRADAETAIAAGDALEHHTLPGTGWVSREIRGADDVDAGLSLLRAAHGRATR